METIKKNSFCILCFFVMLTTYWGTTTYSLFHTSGVDSYISILFSFVLSFIPLLIYYLLLNHNSKLNIVGLVNKNFGKLGILINIIFSLFALFLAINALWNLTNFISSQYLYQTPKVVITILFAIASSYIVYKGFETLGNSATIFFIINISLFILTILSLFSKIELDKLLPTFEFGINPVLKGTLIHISYNVLPLFFMLIISKDNIYNNKNLTKSFLKIYLLTFVIFFIIVFFTISILGIDLSKLYLYPEYHILKTINLANFFQRVESILSVQIIFSYIIQIAFYLYYVKTSIKQNLKIKKDYLILIFSVIILIFLSNNIFTNNTLAEYYSYHIIPYINYIVLLGIPLIILLVSKLKTN